MEPAHHGKHALSLLSLLRDPTRHEPLPQQAAVPEKLLSARILPRQQAVEQQVPHKILCIAVQAADLEIFLPEFVEPAQSLFPAKLLDGGIL